MSTQITGFKSVGKFTLAMALMASITIVLAAQIIGATHARSAPAQSVQTEHKIVKVNGLDILCSVFSILFLNQPRNSSSRRLRAARMSSSLDLKCL